MHNYVQLGVSNCMFLASNNARKRYMKD